MEYYLLYISSRIIQTKKKNMLTFNCCWPCNHLRLVCKHCWQTCHPMFVFNKGSKYMKYIHTPWVIDKRKEYSNIFSKPLTSLKEWLFELQKFSLYGLHKTCHYVSRFVLCARMKESASFPSNIFISYIEFCKTIAS